MLIVPPIGWKVVSAGGPGGGYSFNMTAGSIVGVFFGYDTGTYGYAGSIDGEPVPGYTLGVCFSAPTVPVSVIGYNAEVPEIVGLDVWVNGVHMPGSTFSLDEGRTGSQFGDGTEFEEDNSYFIEFK